jgi:hypothetical protein|tara:strand:+ start:47 stop:736 length:690 start_codon:yes stop_codon:yes gene_type:complete
MFNYDKYNREERFICGHLFRLLHEPNDNNRAIRDFLSKDFKNPFKIYAEVALIRDAYFVRKPNHNIFLDRLVKIVMKQEEIQNCRLYTNLPFPLNDASKTHPSHIKRQAKDELSNDEKKVYGAIQGMFNAKPDLVICWDENLWIYEAKFTLNFNRTQLKRTEKIGNVWASLLYNDLGFDRIPNVRVLTLGLQKYNPNVSWEDIASIAAKVYPKSDNTRVALENALNFGG